MAFFLNNDIEEKGKYEQKIKKLCSKYSYLNLTTTIINYLDSLLQDSTYNEALFIYLDTHGLYQNKKTLLNLIKDLEDIREGQESLYNKLAIDTYIFVTFGIHDINSKINHYLSLFNDTYLNIKKTKENEDDIKNAYTLIFSEDERHNTDIIASIIKIKSRLLRVLFNFIPKEQRKKFISIHYRSVYNYAYTQLDKEEKEYLISILIRNNIYLKHNTYLYNSPIEASMAKAHSTLLQRLKYKYKELYIQNTKKEFNDEEFILFILNSEVLYEIYVSPEYSLDDIRMVNALLYYFISKKVDVKTIQERIDSIILKQSIEERSFCAQIINTTDKDSLNRLLNDYQITRDNFFDYIRNKKFLDKNMKENLLLKLSMHFNTSYLSISTILIFIQEAQDKEVTIETVLRDNGIDINYFNKVLKELENNDPASYEIIVVSMAGDYDNSAKLLRLYTAYINSNITDYYSFVNRFKLTPDEFLALFEDTEYFDSIHESLLEWYNFGDKSQEEQEALNNNPSLIKKGNQQ